jgi:hypothetical protein
MYMTTTERIVGSFSNDELKRMIVAVRSHNIATGKQNDPLIGKLVDAFLLSNELESVEAPRTAGGKMGVAEAKAWMANQ